MTGWQAQKATGALILRDGTRLEGRGLGATGIAAGEVCFNTAMTGYQEILTDPSYAGQIITFTFPHIGNVGVNDDDIETVNMAGASGVRGVILRADVTQPANWRALKPLDEWLRARGIVGLAGIDTRALTARIRTAGMPDASIAHAPDGNFDEAAMTAALKNFPGLEGLDLLHGGRQTRDQIDVRPRHLLDELPRVGAHRIEEAPLAFGEDDIECECAFA